MVEDALVGAASQLVVAWARRIEAVFGQVVADRGLTPTQLATLAALHDAVRAPQARIARIVGCDPSNLTSVVDRLEKLGLVERHPDPSDRRVKNVQLSALGERTVTEIWAEASRRTPLHELDGEDVVRLHAILGGGASP